MNFIYIIIKIKRYDRREITSVECTRNPTVAQCSEKRLRKYI